MPISEYQHVFDTWAVYPRPYYFKKRFVDLYSRYENITSNAPYPSLFENEKLTDKLEKLKCQLGNNLQVIVIGRDNLQRKEFAIATEAVPQNPGQDDSLLQTKGTSTTKQMVPDVSAVICYAKVDNYDSKGLQDVVDTLERFTSMKENKVPGLIGLPFIVCQTSTTAGKIRTEKFRSDILSKVDNKFGIKLDIENVIMGLDGRILGEKISRSLEIEIVQGIAELGDHLNTFCSNNRRLAADTLDIIESEQLLSTIQGFLKNGLAFVDMLENKDDEPFIETVLRNLARVIRCAVLIPLSAKNNLRTDTCNIVAHEVKFEYNVAESVSKNSRYHLSKLQKPCEEMVEATKSGNKCHRFPGENFTFIAYLVKEDIKKPLLQLEEEIKAVCRTAAKMKKMLFEIDSYMKLSIATSEELEADALPDIPDVIRKELFKIDGVYGMGTIYDEIQIHVNVKDDQMEVAQNAVSDIMDQFQFRLPYRVMRILHLPQLLYRCETGKRIEWQPERGGTLGWVVRGNNNQLYGLTSAHIVRGEDEGEHSVFIRTEAEERHLFAKSLPNMAVVGVGDGSCIDIAAVNVVKESQEYCTLLLKDEQENERRSEICTDTRRDLLKRSVYKYGATTDLTRGVICSFNYSANRIETKDYLILIEYLAGSLDGEYAGPGDSGSINCLLDIMTDECPVKAVSMISAGRFKIEEDVYCMSFLLSKGIEKLSEESGVEFNCS